MGGCISSSQPEANEHEIERRSTFNRFMSILKPSGVIGGVNSEHITSTWSATWEEGKWVDDIKDIWSREFQHLPVHVDMPRLVQKIKVTDKDGKFVDLPQSIPKVEMCRTLVTTLASLVGESEERIAILRDQYFDFVKEDGSGDIAQQLLRYFLEVVKYDSDTAKVLRAMHQKVMFPPFYYIRNKLPTLQFKDQRNTWQVTVCCKKSGIEVRHKKRQEGKPQQGQTESDYSFEWELVMKMSKDLSCIDKVRIRLRDLQVNPEAPKKRKAELEKLFFKEFKLETDDEYVDVASGSETNGSGKEEAEDDEEIRIQEDSDDN